VARRTDTHEKRSTASADCVNNLVVESACEGRLRHLA